MAAWRTSPFPCNAHLTPLCGFRYSPYVKGLSSCVFFNFICYPTPPRQVGGRGPRGALDRHPSAGPRRWRPAPASGGPWRRSPIGYIAGNLRGINDSTCCGFDNSKSFHQILCSLSTATSGSGWSMAVGSEQHLKYTPYLRGVWPQRWI
jgi:hypothetical protein